jgi:hypothetical protein
MTVDDLKMLLALNGNNRIPHLEEEIFTSEELYNCYICELSKGKMWYSQHNEIDGNNISLWLFFYAKYTMESRWPEAEHIIAKSRVVSNYYNSYTWQ